MPDINILDDATINKIAAGEVVERPANIVKELVENSIDAGADAISIEIKGGGADLIRVSDNGSGLDRDSVPKAFMRHATSKIHSADDLMSVTSLGFRGEALASIAAVSRVEMLTKTKGSIVGSRFCIQGGKVTSFDDAGVADGTTVIVRDLFYNTPARRKFLKSANTEGNHITELVERLILSHPEISFRYISQGVQKLSGNGSGDSIDDIYSIFGRDVFSNIVEAGYTDEGLQIRAYVGKPAIARGNKNCEIFFVNNRYVKSRILSNACEEAFKPYLMLHRFPFIILYIDIPQSDIDVNVHPSKTEIRFCDEQYVYRKVFTTVTAAVTKKELIPEMTKASSAPAYAEKPGITSEADDDAKDTDTDEHVTYQAPEPFDGINMALFREAVVKMHEEEKKAMETADSTLFREGFLGENNRSEHNIIGQVFDTYWIVEFDGRMYIIDQHAAHEKVLYERIRKKVAKNELMSQLISPPYIVSLSPSQEEAVRQRLEVFEEMGFTVSHFGGREYALSSVPVELFGMNEQEYFLAIVDDLVENNRIREPEEVKDRIATMACKAAVKGNMKMSFAEAQALIDELLELDNPYNCPHGRPTIISFSKNELEKMFKRIV